MSDTAKYALIALGGYALFNLARNRPLLYVPTGIVRNGLSNGPTPQQYDPATSNGNTNNLIQTGFNFAQKGFEVFTNIWNQNKSNGAPDTTDSPIGYSADEPVYSGGSDMYNPDSYTNPWTGANYDGV